MIFRRMVSFLHLAYEHSIRTLIQEFNDRTSTNDGDGLVAMELPTPPQVPVSVSVLFFYKVLIQFKT